MNSGIYTITHTKSNKMYVGSTVNFKKRFRSHKNSLLENTHRCSHLQRAYNKYGADEFTFAIIEYVEPVKHILLKAEQTWMDKFKETKILYNTCPIAGSPLGMKLTLEQRAKISMALKGKPKTAKHNEANAAAQRARIRTPEEINRFASNRRGSKQSEEHKRKKNESLRISKAKRTDEQKLITRIKYCNSRKTTVIIEGITYISYSAASSALGISIYFLCKRYPKMSPTVSPQMNLPKSCGPHTIP